MLIPQTLLLGFAAAVIFDSIVIVGICERVVKNVDVGFIHFGQTTRAEIKEKLKLIDTGYQGDRFFLGRWASSTWGGWIILAGMCCEAVGGGGMVWKSGNLLVEFDDSGTVVRSEPFPAEAV